MTAVQDAFFQDAFISYGQTDSKKFAIDLKERLKARGLNQIWLDLHDIPPVTDWQQRIDEAIGRSHHVIYIISPSALASTHCQKELALARQYGKPGLFHSKNALDSRFAHF